MEKGKVRIAYTCIIAFFVIAFVTFVLTPFTADLKVFTASANIASYKGINLFYDAYNTWELKGVFNRVLVYAMYNIATLFTDFGTFPFERAIKLIYACIIILFSFVSVSLANKNKDVSKNIFFTLFLSLAFLTTRPSSSLQAEMSSTLFLVLGFALYINAEQSKSYETLKLLAAGLCIGITFFFKSATLIMSVAFVAAAYLWNVNHNCKPIFRKLLLLVAGSVIMLAIGIVSILIINPDEMQDMLYASMFQRTLLNGGEIHILGICHNFIAHYVQNFVPIPFLIVGTIALFINLYASLKNKLFVSILMHLILWTSPALFIIISNKYFGYHYVTFIFPSIIEVYLCVESLTESQLKNTKIASMCAAYFVATIIYLAFISVFSPICRTYIILNKKAYKQNSFISSMNFDEPILYLDDGIGAYLLGADTYIKYYFPLPIQRITDDSEFKDIKCRIETLRQIQQYQGKYVVVYDNWIFGEGKNNEVKAKILREYDKIGELTRYTPHSKLFSCDTEEDFKYFDLYQRKPNIDN